MVREFEYETKLTVRDEASGKTVYPSLRPVRSASLDHHQCHGIRGALSGGWIALLRDGPRDRGALFRHCALTDQIFGTCQLLGFRCAPRIRDLADQRLHPFEKASSYLQRSSH
jgi:Tn3 transposase DDE domain